MKRLLTYLTVAIIMLMVPIGTQAWNSLNMRGGSYDWNSNDTGSAFTKEDGNTFTKEVTPTSAGNYYFRIYCDDEGDRKQWGPNSDSNDEQIALGSTVNAYQNKTNKAFYFSAEKDVTYIVTAIYKQVDGTWRWTIKVEKKTTASFKKGLYIYGEKYDGTNPSYLHYKLQPVVGTTDEYYFDLFAARLTMSGCNNGNTGNGISDEDNMYFDLNESTFKLAYVANDGGSVTSYGASAGGGIWKLKSTNAESDQTGKKDFGGNYWQLYNVENGGGYYRFYIKVDADGKPSKWWYTSHDDAYVAYKLGESSDWTIDGFYYGKKNGTSFNGNYFGTTNFTQNEDFCFIVGGVWFKRRKSENNQTYTKNISTDASGLNDLKFEYSDGVYLVELNPTRTDYILKGASPTTPLTVQIIGSAVTPTTITSTDFNAWDLEQRVQMPYNEQEACWKLTGQKLTSGKLMRFLARNVKYDNFGEDGNVPGNGVDTWNNNYVNRNVVGSSETPTGTNIAFTGKTGLYTIRFYAEEDATGNVTYRYTLELEEEINDPDATLSPGTDGGEYISYKDESVVLTVTLDDGATKYGYACSTTAGQQPGNDRTDTNFGKLTYDGTNIKLNDGVVASNSNTVYITIQGKDDDGNVGNVHTYQYTFRNSEAPVGFTPAGGFFINRAIVTAKKSNEDNPGFKWKAGFSTKEEALEAGKDEQNLNDTRNGSDELGGTLSLSTPGWLVVKDDAGNISAAYFDFTYSTSENYKNFWNNGTVSQVVQTGGGKGALNVFLKKNDNLTDLSVYAYNWTLDQELKNGTYVPEQGVDYSQVGNRDPYVALSDYFPGQHLDNTRTMVIDGDTYYYYTIPQGNLREGDKVAIIVSQGESGVERDDDHAVATQTTEDGTIVPTSNNEDPMFFYMPAVDDNYDTDTGNKNKNYIFEVTADGSRTIFFNLPDNSWLNGYPFCHAWSSTNNASLARKDLKWGTSAEYASYDAASGLYFFNVPIGMDRIVLSSTSVSDDQTVDITYKGGRVKYTIASSKNSDNKTRNVTSSTSGVPSADVSELTAFLEKDPTTTVVTEKYPNGEDYVRNAPGDLTVKLDPTWGGHVEPLEQSGGDLEVVEEVSIANWSGFPVSSNSEEYNNYEDADKYGYKKLINGGTKLSQTVKGLNADKSYTVQAIVRGLGENGKTVTLTLEGATTEKEVAKLRHAGGDANEGYGYAVRGSEITKTGRVEYLNPGDLTDKQEGTGWKKIEVTAKPTQAGWLTISIEGNEWFDLADMTLLEEANTDHGFRTTATYPAGEFTGQAVDATSDSYTTNWYADYRDRVSTSNEQKNNAYSFFDRGKDWNAIVYASDHTVIALDNSLLTAYKDGEKEVDLSTQQHRHPYNVVAVDGDGNKTCDVVYLTDLGGAGETSGTNYYITSHNFGISDNFTTKKVIFDRNFNTATTTLCLPFAITANDLKTILNGGTGTGDVKIYTLNSADLAKNTIEYQLIADEANIAAFTPLIVKGQVAGEHMKNAELLTKEDYEISFEPSYNSLNSTYVVDDNNNTTAEFNGVTTMTGFYTEGDADGRHWKNFLFNAEDGDDFGKFVWAEPWESHFSGYIKPFRCYMTLWGDAADGDAKEFSVVWNDTPAEPIVEKPVDEPVDEPVVEPEEPGSETTGIASIEQLLKKGNVYTVDGRLVSRNMIAGGLQKGIYMVNGKKFVIK